MTVRNEKTYRHAYFALANHIYIYIYIYIQNIKFGELLKLNNQK